MKEILEIESKDKSSPTIKKPQKKKRNHNLFSSNNEESLEDVSFNFENACKSFDF